MKFLNCWRTFRMDMDTYMSGLRTANKRMKQHDPSMTMSDLADALRPLRRSGLTLQERKQI